MFIVDALAHSETQIIFLNSTKRLPYGKGKGDFTTAKIAVLCSVALTTSNRFTCLLHVCSDT